MIDDVTDSWSVGFAPDTQMLVAAKGWRSPEDAIRSYMHLERLVGNDRLVVPTLESSEDERSRFWGQLGRPDAPEGYNLTPPEDGSPYDADHAAWFRGTAHRIGLTDDQACSLHDEFLDRCREAARGGDDADDSLAQVRQAWGGEFPSRMSAARRALSTYVIEDAELGAIADKIGDVALMNLLAKIGSSLSEDSLVGGRANSDIGGPDVGAEIERLQAEARSDPRHPYLDKTHPEHASAVRRMQSLFERAHRSRD